MSLVRVDEQFFDADNSQAHEFFASVWIDVVHFEKNFFGHWVQSAKKKKNKKLKAFYIHRYSILVPTLKIGSVKNNTESYLEREYDDRLKVFIKHITATHILALRYLGAN